MSKSAKYKLLVESLRIREVLLMTGFSFIGILFTDIHAWTNRTKNIAVFFFVLFYVLAVYFLNSLAGYEKDIQSQRLKIIGVLSKQEYTKLFILFSFLFAAIGLYINGTVFTFSMIALFLWGMYYLPPFRFKSTFLLGTFIHLLAGILHFHTGYCSFNGLNNSSVIISVFFALLLCIGHFHHEIIDYEADKASGYKTTAVRIGLHKMHLLRTVLTGFSLCYWTVIYFENYITSIEFAAFLIPTVALFILSVILKENTTKKFQKISRSMFLTAGILLLLIKFTGLIKTYF